MMLDERTGFPFHFPRSNNNHGKHLKQMSSKLVGEYIGEWLKSQQAVVCMS